MSNDDKLMPITTRDLDVSVDASIKDVVEDIVGANDPQSFQQLTAIFNQNIAKKNMIRVLKLNGVLDKLSEEALNRVLYDSHNIEDKDLISYLKTIQDIIDKSTKSTEIISEQTPISLNQTNNVINITNTPQLPPDSRQKVLNVVEEILKMSNNNNER